MRISGHVQAIINAAYNEARVRNHEYLTPEHILYAALAFDEVQGVFTACGADLEQIKAGMETYFEQKVPVVSGAEPTQTVGFQSVIERAVQQMQSSQKEMLDVADIIVSLFDEERNYCAYYLRKAGVRRFELLSILSHGFDGDNPFDVSGMNSAPPPGREDFGRGLSDDEINEGGQKVKSNKKSALERYA
ncbi:MAG: ATP-dependent Clp protease ATP-binding subunit ClpA, partial [Treponema sp.]|nr:ATP-dependent Clp protease ATP-binding subunit ClpA [Treponema sp.]